MPMFGLVDVILAGTIVSIIPIAMMATIPDAVRTLKIHSMQRLPLKARGVFGISKNGNLSPQRRQNPLGVLDSPALDAVGLSELDQPSLNRFCRLADLSRLFRNLWFENRTQESGSPRVGTGIHKILSTWFFTMRSGP
jgi:hypothetical protein